MSAEPNYNEWTLRSLYGEIHNLSAESERDISAALKLGQIEKAGRIFAKYEERIGYVLSLLKERISK